MAPTCHLQIVGEIKAARDALVELTSRIRSYLYRELFRKDTTPPVSASALEISPNNTFPLREAHTGNNLPMKTYQNLQTGAIALASKVVLSVFGWIKKCSFSVIFTVFSFSSDILFSSISIRWLYLCLSLFHLSAIWGTGVFIQLNVIQVTSCESYLSEQEMLCQKVEKGILEVAFS